MLTKFFDLIESLNKKWIRALLFLFILFFLRVYFENIFFPIEINRFVLVHEISFFFWCFFLILTLFCVFIKEDLDKLFSASSIIISLVILAPFLDKFIFGRIQPYDYTLTQNFWLNLRYFFWKSANVGKGLIIELMLIIIFIAVYTFYKTKSFFKLFFLALLSYTGIQLIAAPKIYLPIPEIGGFASLIPYFAISERLLYFIFYFLFSLFLIIFILFLKKREPVVSLLKNTRPLRTLNFIILTIAGLVVAEKLSFSYPDWIFGLLALLGVLFLWQSSVIINDVFDAKIDGVNLKKRPLVLNIIQPDDYLFLGFILGFIGVVFSFLMGNIPFICGGIFFLLALIYSIPPFRLRKGLLAYPVIGLGSALSFMIGYSSGTFHFNIENFKLGIISSLYVLAALTIGSVTKDAEDYEGDREMGIKNFFIVLGKERARKVISILLFIGFLSPLLFISQYFDILFFLSIGTAASVIFYKKMNYPLTILFYLIAATYFIFRL